MKLKLTVFLCIIVALSNISMLLTPGYSKPVSGFIAGQPHTTRKIPPSPPPIPEPKPVSSELGQLQKNNLELRNQRDKLEKDIDLSVTRVRQLKTELKHTNNPVSKYFYRRQLETQLESFRGKVDRLRLIESRLNIIIHELGKQIVLDKTNSPSHQVFFPEQSLHQKSLHPPLVLPDWEPEPLSFPSGFELWQPKDKVKFIQDQITRISQEKKQFEFVIKLHQKDLIKLNKMLEETKISIPNSPQE